MYDMCSLGKFVTLAKLFFYKLFCMFIYQDSRACAFSIIAPFERALFSFCHKSFGVELKKKTI